MIMLASLRFRCCTQFNGDSCAGASNCFSNDFTSIETHPLSEGKYPNLQIHEESHKWKVIVSALAMALCYNILAGYNAHEKLNPVRSSQDFNDPHTDQLPHIMITRTCGT